MTYIVEYSQSQAAFHVGDAADLARKNLTDLLTGKRSDWLYLGSFPTCDAANRFIREVQARMWEAPVLSNQ